MELDQHAFASRLGQRIGEDEHVTIQLRYVDLPAPLQRTELLLTSARVDGEQRHLGDVGRQLGEQLALLVPRERVRLASLAVLTPEQRRRIEERPPVVVTSDARRQREHAIQVRKLLIHRARRCAICAPLLPVFVQRSVVRQRDVQRTNERHEVIQREARAA